MKIANGVTFFALKRNAKCNLHKNYGTSSNFDQYIVTFIRISAHFIFAKRILCVFAKPGRAGNINFWLPKVKKCPRGAIWTTFLKQKWKRLVEFLEFHDFRPPGMMLWVMVFTTSGPENHNIVFPRNIGIPCK